MNNTIVVAASSCFAGLFSLFAGAGLYGAAENFITEPEPYGVELVRLDYQNGKFVQHIRPLNTPALKMEWAAKITRNGEIICAGGGASVYTNKTVTMNPDIWTDDDCPSLQIGDVADASWTYETVNGFNVTISGTKELDKL